MVSAYAMSLVPSKFHGRAIAVTMSGSTLGLGIGLPIMTAIGTGLDGESNLAFFLLLFLSLPFWDRSFYLLLKEKNEQLPIRHFTSFVISPLSFAWS